MHSIVYVTCVHGTVSADTLPQLRMPTHTHHMDKSVKGALVVFSASRNHLTLLQRCKTQSSDSRKTDRLHDKSRVNKSGASFYQGEIPLHENESLQPELGNFASLDFEMFCAFVVEVLQRSAEVCGDC